MLQLPESVPLNLSGAAQTTLQNTIHLTLCSEKERKKDETRVTLWWSVWKFQLYATPTEIFEMGTRDGRHGAMEVSRSQIIPTDKSWQANHQLSLVISRRMKNSY
ncbi:unnamed protein product [Natator depressus]